MSRSLVTTGIGAMVGNPGVRRELGLLTTLIGVWHPENDGDGLR
jgi:hypothetical protein